MANPVLASRPEVPVLVFANKADHDDAMGATDLSDALNLDACLEGRLWECE